MAGLLKSLLRGATQSVMSVTVSPDNRQLFAASSDKNGYVWNMLEGSLLVMNGVSVFLCQELSFFFLRHSHTYGSDMCVCFLDVFGNKTSQHTLTGHSNKVSTGVFIDRRRIVRFHSHVSPLFFSPLVFACLDFFFVTCKYFILSAFQLPTS